jgi:hypothetical protein
MQAGFREESRPPAHTTCSHQLASWGLETGIHPVEVDHLLPRTPIDRAPLPVHVTCAARNRTSRADELSLLLERRRPHLLPCPRRAFTVGSCYGRDTSCSTDGVPILSCSFLKTLRCVALAVDPRATPLETATLSGAPAVRRDRREPRDVAG